MLIESREQGDFWIALLKFGSNEEERKRNWNIQCRSMFIPLIDQFGLGRQVHSVFEKLIDPPPNHDDELRILKFVDMYGDHFDIVDDALNIQTRHMNFDRKEFSDSISFSGRALFGATFRNAKFGKEVDFSNAEFFGVTDFTKATFLSEDKSPSGVACFTGSSFHGLTKFDAVQFPYTTKFDEVSWHGPAWFNEAEFKPNNKETSPLFASVDFGRSKFERDADFSNVVFGVEVDCRNATFEDAVKFEETVFRFPASFSRTKFTGATSFWKASFNKPPSFFAV